MADEQKKLRNTLFSKVNQYINEYLNTHKATPFEIHRYVKKNMGKFIKDILKVEDTEETRKIVFDVIEHIKNMQKDKVYKFEQLFHKVNESILPIGIDSKEHINALSDFYNTSIDHIEIINSDYHIFEVTFMGDKEICMIFSKDELNSLNSSIVQNLKENILKKVVSVDSVFGVTLGWTFNFEIDSLINVDDLSLVNVDQNLLMRSIAKVIPNLHNRVQPNLNLVCYRSNPDVIGNFYVWELKSDVSE